VKFLHTADWHLGRSLYGRKRYDEFSAFLDWLGDVIEEERIDALLVAGDVFDTSTPSNRAQELYYRFLCRVSASCCSHVVIIAGNHDSPSFLNAPRELLQALNVHVIGAIADDLRDEVIVLKTNPQTAENQEAAVVCAVPYLRDKDIRTVAPGETIEDKNRKLLEGIKNHYAEVVRIAERKREDLIRQSAIKNPQSQVPIIAMGHLFTSDGKTVDGDGVRELYVGSLVQVGEDVFPSCVDYAALGHLHVPQSVGGAEHIRYSGSPIPMGYGEATRDKKAIVVDFSRARTIEDIKVPCFQPLVRIEGSLDVIHAKIENLKQADSSAWLEVEYTGSDIIGNLREILDDALSGSAMEIRRIRNRRIMDQVIKRSREEETLDDLNDDDVFRRCMDASDVPDRDREELTASYKEIVTSLREEDLREA